MQKPFPKVETVEALKEALPTNDVGSSQDLRGPGFMYLPQSHAKALDLDNILVEGMRGAGKSFWFTALNNPEYRSVIDENHPGIGLSKNLTVSQGWGLGASDPSKDSLRNLLQQYDPRQIWRTVIANQLEFKAPFPYQEKWDFKVAWVIQNPEEYEVLLHERDSEYAKSSQKRLILFDALDRLADNWPEVRALARGIFQLALDPFPAIASR